MPQITPEEKKEYKRLWYLKNKEKINERCKLYRQQQKEEIILYREKMNEYQRLKYHENKDNPDFLKKK